MTPPSPVSKVRSELGGFRVESLLTRTQATWIYRARSITADDEVLLEVLHTDGAAGEAVAERLATRRSAARRLGHPHIAVVHSTGVEDDLAYIATRDPGGIDLGTLLEGLGAVSLDRAARHRLAGRGARSTPRTRRVSRTAPSSPPGSWSPSAMAGTMLR